MSHDDHRNAQPLRELEWLAHYFKENSREDLAQEIFQQVKQLRHRAQASLSGDTAEIIDLNDRRQRSAEGSE